MRMEAVFGEAVENPFLDALDKLLPLLFVHIQPLFDLFIGDRVEIAQSQILQLVLNAPDT